MKKIFVDYSHDDLTGEKNLVDGTVTVNCMSFHKPSVGFVNRALFTGS